MTGQTLSDALAALAAGEDYPFHMPGHKRQPADAALHTMDITEIDGFDDLHETTTGPQAGLIGELEERAADLYRADRSYLLVNGSTAGVLAAVSACCPGGSCLVAGRNSHRRLYHAAYLRNVRLTLAEPEYLPDWACYGVLSPRKLEETLSSLDAKENPGGAVFVTSPTYEGICSDIRALADIAHAHGLPLIVDQAHGAHFGLDGRLPENALTQGADLVIMSLHKTLPAVTQTAILHAGGDRIDHTRLRRFLRIYQTSSPSYLLMRSIDDCIRGMRTDASHWCDRLLTHRQRIDAASADFTHVRLSSWAGKEKGKTDAVDAALVTDPCKLLVSAPGFADGRALYELLRVRYHLQPEMAAGPSVLLILTGSDTEQGITRLIHALQEIDRMIPDMKSNQAESEREGFTSAQILVVDGAGGTAETDLSAWDAPRTACPLAAAKGRIAAEFVTIYPPGIPQLIPGRRITAADIRILTEAIRRGCTVHGLQEISRS